MLGFPVQSAGHYLSGQSGFVTDPAMAVVVRR